ncbi:hypothetical protein [Roseibaca sp. Y0-43]|uniref:hypothetical protein n=1 Tax=Roseibaca sp. Y0-43 TaxID=2816854 RepID=UPI001D0CC22C|nr:hypothetical protein [Roseibaca sp. Y0-43]MCC1482079.1 hypothetical protein [Roseibaca sp. Y0-43]
MRSRPVICLIAMLACAAPAGADTPCTATESELFEAFVKAGLGIMGANNRVIAVSNAASTTVISDNPFTYEIDDAKLCEMLAQAGDSSSYKN